MPDMKAEAERYIGMGFGVIALRSMDKRPHTLNGLKDATHDYDQVDQAWTYFPDDNIGIVTGAESGIVVIDVDVDETTGEDGFEFLNWWESNFGELPETASVKTQRGGTHLYYRLPPGMDVRNSTSPAHGIDVRGTGGYVVAPPSVGQMGTYDWENDPEDVPIQFANDAVFSLIYELQGKKIRNIEDGKVVDFTRFKLPDVIPQGCRQDTLFRFACSLQSLGYSDADIVASVEQAAKVNCVPPADESDVKAALSSALKYPKGEKVEAFVMSHKPVTADEERKPIGSSSGTDAFGNPQIEHLDLHTPTHKEPELISGLIRRGCKGLIVADSKAGKTWMVMELAVSVAMGRQWLGFECKAGRVLYVNMELQAESARSRFMDIVGRWGMRLTDEEKRAVEGKVDVWNLRGYTKPLTEDGGMTRTIINALKGDGEHACGYDLIILDPFYKLLNGDENDAQVIGEFCRELDKIVNEANCTVIYVHHHAKGDQSLKKAADRASGSGVFARDADLIIDLVELSVSDSKREMNPNLLTQTDLDGNRRNCPCFRAEFIVRDGWQVPETDLVFRWPLHIVDEGCVLSDCRLRNPQSDGGKSHAAKVKEESESRSEAVRDALERILVESFGALIPLADAVSKAASNIGAECSDRTIRRLSDDVKNDSRFVVSRSGKPPKNYVGLA